MADTVTLTIDDKQITVPAGTLVVDAARALGIQIPVFCSHPKLDPVGVCRMCMVEYVTPRGNRLDVSCTVPVTEGMVVRTDTPQVVAVREAMLSFLLINHPLDCPICDKGGECPLQDQTMQYGPGASKFVEVKVHKAKHHPVSEFIMLDQERCVLCWRCFRYLEEWEDQQQLGLFQRGDRTVIDAFPGQPVDVKTSGSVIDICPVGALTDRTARFNFRPWEIKSTASVCTLCPVGCNIRLDERVHELRRIVARENPAINDMWICDKGRFVHEYVDHAERLKTPMIRENGALRPATWSEAINRLVERFVTLEDAHGRTALGGIAGGRVSNETAYLFQKFFRTMVGTNNVDFPTGAAVRALPGGLPAIADVGKHDLIVLVGVDTNESAPALDLFIKRAAHRQGTKLMVINPRCTELARYNGAFLPVRPGAEALLINGLSAAVLNRREETAAAGRRRPAAGASQPGADEWAWVRPTTPEQVQAGTGVALAALGPAAELLLGAQRPLFLYGPDAATGTRGQAAVTALQNLAGLLGHGDKVSYVPTEANSQGLRDMGLLPTALPGHQALTDGAVRERLGKLWGVTPPAEVGQTYEQMLNGGVRALWIIGANPGADPLTAEPLRGLDCLVVQDLFLTETAQLAEVVLPANSFAESDGTYTNLDRHVQRAPRAVKTRGEDLADWEILTAVAQRWQAAVQAPESPESPAEPDWKRKRQRKAAAGPKQPVAKPWTYTSAAVILDEIGRAVPLYANFHWETLGTDGAQWPAAAVARTGRRIEPIAAPQVPALAQGSFWLVSGSFLWNGSPVMQHSHKQVLARRPEPFVALHPSDLAQSGLAEGGQVTVSSERGSVTLLLRADTSVQPGMAWVPLDMAGAPAETLGAGRGEPVSVQIR